MGSIVSGLATISSRGGILAAMRPRLLYGSALLVKELSTFLLGTSVLTPTFRYQPAIVAQAFGTWER